jgi:hypothetical protein
MRKLFALKSRCFDFLLRAWSGSTFVEVSLLARSRHSQFGGTRLVEDIATEGRAHAVRRDHRSRFAAGPVTRCRVIDLGFPDRNFIRQNSMKARVGAAQAALPRAQKQDTDTG